MKVTSTLVACGLAALCCSRAAEVDLSKLPPPASRSGITYDNDIRPIFQKSCFRCHGEEQQKHGLRLDSLEAALKGSKDGKVIIPGQSTKSLLLIAVARLDPKKSMPPQPRPGRFGRRRGGPPGPGPGGPPNFGPNGPGPRPGGPRRGFGPPPKPLTTEQVSLIRAWIDQGAE